MKKALFIYICFNFGLILFVSSQITDDLSNIKWSYGKSYTKYGHSVIPISGTASDNFMLSGNATNIGYRTIEQIKAETKVKADKEKWDSVKLKMEYDKIDKSLIGGRLDVYIVRHINELDNFKFFPLYVEIRSVDESIMFSTNTSISFLGSKEEYYFKYNMVSIDINKKLPDSFYVYLNEQSSKLHKFKFKIIKMPEKKEYISFYNNNQIFEKGTLEGGLKNGKWLSYHPNGKIGIIENYIEGKRNGLTEEYYDDGGLAAEKEFKNGLPDGIWKLYYYKILIDGRYKDNKKDSSWKYYDTIGHIKAVGTYQNDLKNGSWTYYLNSHKESEGNYTENTEHGEWKLFDTLGNVIAKGKMKSGKEELGSWSYFSADGKPITPDTTLLLVADKMPQFRDGNIGMMMFIKENANFPPAAMENVNGKVFLSFVVEPNGCLSNITLLKGIKPEIDTELLRVFSIMPRWIPGVQGGNLARVKMIMPVKIGG